MVGIILFYCAYLLFIVSLVANSSRVRCLHAAELVEILSV